MILSEGVNEWGEPFVEGSKGDWEKEGYKLSHTNIPSSSGDWGLGGMVVRATDKKGKEVASAEIHFKDKNTLYPRDLFVDPSHRRKGLANAMYDYAERETGKELIPSDAPSKQAKALWKNRLSEGSVTGIKSSDLKEFLDTINDYKDWNPGDPGDDGEGSIDDTSGYFKNPSRVPSTTELVHFTNENTEEIIKNGFDGCGPGNLGLTRHYGCNGFGTLSFAFTAKEAKKEWKQLQSKYGKNVISFHAKEAVRVFHSTDEEWQVVFDVEGVSDLKSVSNSKDL